MSQIEVKISCDKCGTEAEVESLDDFPSGKPLPCGKCGAPLCSREELEKQVEAALENELKKKLSAAGFDVD